jgi:hypothetical protein
MSARNRLSARQRFAFPLRIAGDHTTMSLIDSSRSRAAAVGRRFYGHASFETMGGLQCRLLTLRDVGSRVGESGVETSAVRSQLFNVGFCPLARKDAIK